MKPLAQHTNTLFTKIIDHNRQIATDLTGKFPVTSNRENSYLFISYEYYSNTILIQPTRARSDIKFIQVFKDLHDHILTRGAKPAYTRLGN